ncbi:efflux RND transporter permease subunit [Phnomibacter ginsenosidimutans]|uniref:MMPL family transporter n=1 Tax=Phnomibacter ginsenosidimutans TaxID=2676868 RepID=A0A6I6GB09_9BACT|nr:MMPL family transporter [Phnomibacter ginsenosidimutans]QGW29594.1 MMPL family transporter [Phnomibacter ginsenosidimutans]
MWYRLGKFVLQYRLVLLIVLFVASGFMTWHALQVKLSYEFSKAIPTDNEKYLEYQAFKNKFGEDGSVLVMGVEDPQFFSKPHFDAYRQMLADIKQVRGVEGLLSVPAAIYLQKNDSTEKLQTTILFDSTVQTQEQIDSAAALFNGMFFYRGLLHNPDTKAYLAGATINKQILASKDRTRVVNEILEVTNRFHKSTGVQVHMSGLPFIRTQIADRIKNEMNYFLIGSLALAVLTLVLFFRSASATLISMLVVILGVAWALGTMHLFGFQITLLNALIPPLMIVIGIPNCIYFLNKYHMSWEEIQAREKAQPSGASVEVLKREALLNMVSKMGIVTLFCNIAAAVGFAVFALTESALLKEFGIVAGINIMVIFVISFILIPSALSYLAPPEEKHTRYLRNRFLENLLVKVEYWVLQRRKMVYAITAVCLVVAVLGILRLKSVGYIVDDLPKNDVIYTDPKWFEKQFGGVMPLEIVVDAGKKGAITRNLKTITKMDELAEYINGYAECGRPLSLVEGLKFAKQAYYDGDSLSYMVPNEFDMAFIGPYLKGGNNANADTSSQLAKLTKTFMDTDKQQARISINMADVGTVRLAALLDSFKLKADTIFNLASLEPKNAEQPDGPMVATFDSTYKVKFTGSSVTYLEGSRFIINGLKESIFWAFLLIALTMLYLFKSVRILVCSLIPNIIPLVVTAGIMGWAGVAIKPSTVLVFSVALGIAIDVTIRFLVNYKQELPTHHNNILATTTSTIRHTGISIIYTSLVLVAGFVIFMFSSFGGTFALGWLTSLTLLVATVTNLVFLPVIMLAVLKDKQKG